MARKLQSAAQSIDAATVDAPQADEGAKDLSILVPDITLEIGGRTVTVREPRFLQGLRIRAKAHALARDLTASIKGGEGLTDDVLDVLARHDALVKELICDVTEGADAEWIDGLSDIDGETLMLAWWTCFGPFFIRQFSRRLADEMRTEALVALAMAERASAGSTFTPGSPPPATDASTNSANATPSVN